MNIGMNYIFIRRYGYIAAAYTTLATYFLYFLFHYLIAIKIEGKNLFSNNVMVGCTLGILVAVALGNVLINYVGIRILLVLLLIAIALIYEEKEIGIIKHREEVKKNEQ